MRKGDTWTPPFPRRRRKRAAQHCWATGREGSGGGIGTSKAPPILPRRGPVPALPAPLPAWLPGLPNAELPPPGGTQAQTRSQAPGPGGWEKVPEKDGPGGRAEKGGEGQPRRSKCPRRRPLPPGPAGPAPSGSRAGGGSRGAAAAPGPLPLQQESLRRSPDAQKTLGGQPSPWLRDSCPVGGP